MPKTRKESGYNKKVRVKHNDLEKKILQVCVMTDKTWEEVDLVETKERRSKIVKKYEAERQKKNGQVRLRRVG